MSLRTVVALAVLLALFAGCGSSSACKEAGHKLCAKACDCATDGKCRMVQGTLAITFDNESDCRALYDFGCSMDQSGVDWNACSMALDTAQCVAGGGDMGVDVPAECRDTTP